MNGKKTTKEAVDQLIYAEMKILGVDFVKTYIHVFVRHVKECKGKGMEAVSQDEIAIDLMTRTLNEIDSDREARVRFRKKCVEIYWELQDHTTDGDGDFEPALPQTKVRIIELATELLTAETTDSNNAIMQYLNGIYTLERRKLTDERDQHVYAAERQAVLFAIDRRFIKTGASLTKHLERWILDDSLHVDIRTRIVEIRGQQGGLEQAIKDIQAART